MHTTDILLQPDPNVVSTKLSDDEMVLLHVVTKQYYTLNETGVRIWDLLQAGKHAAEISIALEAEYTVEPEHASRCVSTFIEALKRESLVSERLASA